MIAIGQLYTDATKYIVYKVTGIDNVNHLVYYDIVDRECKSYTTIGAFLSCMKLVNSQQIFIKTLKLSGEKHATIFEK